MEQRPPSPVPDFTPVPRKYRFDGWTPERQRGFIAALAETGSVKAAAAKVGKTKEGAYALRRAPGSQTFCAAWEAALACGVRSLTDIAIERARNGVPVPIFWKGEQVGERRWYNDRLLMFVLRHHLPDRYGAPGRLRGGTRSQETIEREAAEHCPVCRERREADARFEQQARALAERGPGPASAPAPSREATAEPNETERELAEYLDKLFDRYQRKVRAEREYRRSGQIVAADYTLRQLTHLELILDLGGRTGALIDLWTRRPQPGGGATESYASFLSEELDALRHQVWAEESPRPALPHHRRTTLGTAMTSGPTKPTREKARAEAERLAAEAQAMWEATATEESWARWRG